MGMSPDAYLFYGLAFNDDDLYGEWREAHGVDEDGDINLESWAQPIAIERGAYNPWNDQPPDDVIPWREWSEQPAVTEALSAWYAAGRAVEEEYGVDYGFVGGYDYQQAIFYIKASRTSVEWAQTKIIEGMPVGDDWDEKLRRFAELLALPIDEMQGPAWILGVSYG